MSIRKGLAALLLCLASSLAAQTTEPPPPEPVTDPPQALAPPTVLSDAASGAYERRDSLPNVNIYLPEGQASVRLRKLIRNVLFESQIDYKFATGDISTYLRYKYYARTFTYRLGVFDTIEFPDIGQGSSSEFERVRGGLLLLGFPRDNDRRYYGLVQNDRLTFGELENVDNKKNNIYVKVGYQWGTQFDERLNSIVGESRGRITPTLTAFREIGPQKTSYAVALTQTGNMAKGDWNETTKYYDYGIGDYKYTKLEGEVLRRFDITSTSFVFSRLHAGGFLAVDTIPGREDRPEIEQHSIPRYELFRLSGREAMKSIDSNEFTQGTHEIHLTSEYFRPIFRNRDYKTWLLRWNTLYGIGYLGAGSVGFKASQLTKGTNMLVDAGIGAEAGITVRDDFQLILSLLYAQAVKAPGCENEQIGVCKNLKGRNVLFSIRTIR